MVEAGEGEVLLFLELLALGNVLDGAAEGHDPALRPGARKICEPITLHPTDRAVSPPNPELMVDEGLRIGGSSAHWRFARNLSASSGCTRFMRSSINISSAVTLKISL